MFDTLELFELSTARARHAGARQHVVAQNIANADTPGYRAQTISSFEDMYRSLGTDRLSRADFSRSFDSQAPLSPNGNSVSLELEMVAAVDAQRSHTRAMNVYRSALNIMRTSIGR